MALLLSRIVRGIREDPLILPFAGKLLGFHVVLTILMNVVPVNGPWKKTTIFSAKQLISFGMMTYLSYLGFQLWFSDEYQQTRELIQDESSLFPGGVFMSKIVLGQLLYDIPAGLASGDAVDAMMHLHHFGMFTVATVAMGLWGAEDDGPQLVPHYHRYAPFFFGVIELSSIFLQIVDLFHPRKQPLWYQYHNTVPALQKLNEICRILFALSYIVLRMILFPMVMVTQCLPDSWAKWNQPANQEYKTSIAVMVVFMVFFTGLQLYWGSLILAQIAKMLKGGDAEKADQGGKKKAKIKSV